MQVVKHSRRTFDLSHGGRAHRGTRIRRPLSLKASVMVLFKVLVIFVCPLTARTILNAGNPDAKRLYDDLLSNYNKLVRPVVNTTDPLTVRIKLKLSQLIDVVSCSIVVNFRPFLIRNHIQAFGVVKLKYKLTYNVDNKV